MYEKHNFFYHFHLSVLWKGVRAYLFYGTPLLRRYLGNGSDGGFSMGVYVCKYLRVLCCA